MCPPSDQQWLAELPADQQPTPEPTPAPAAAPSAPSQEYAGQVAEIYSGKNIYKLPYTAEIPFKQQGKIMTMAIGKLLNAYNQHLVIQPKYDALMKDFNKIRPEYESLKGREQRFSDLERLQAWSEQNPELFQHIWNSFSNRDKLALQQQLGMNNEQPAAASNVNQQLLDVISGLRGELGELKTWKTQLEQAHDAAEQEANVKMIENEIDSFRKAYPFIDLDSQDETGVMLVEKIIKHGIDRKHQTFKVAALEYLEPQLLERMKDQGRSEAVKGLREQNKQGIVATSNTPFPINGQSPQPADAKKSDSMLLQEAKAMFEQLKQQST